MEEPLHRETATNAHSTLNIVLYILEQLLELFTTAALLTFNVLLPDFKAQLQNMGGVKFNPTTDIPSLKGKVILVTGGTYNPSSLFLTCSILPS